MDGSQHLTVPSPTVVVHEYDTVIDLLLDQAENPKEVLYSILLCQNLDCGFNKYICIAILYRYAMIVITYDMS